MNYLQGVQKVVELCNMSNATAPSTITGQTGDLKKAITLFDQAHEEIQNMYFDWDFLWGTGTITTSSGLATYTGESNLGIWDAERVFYDNNPLEVYDWQEYVPDTSLSNGPPEFAVIRPDNAVLLVPTPDATYSIPYDYYKVPKVLSANTDEPYMPDRFRMAIVGRAVMLWGIYNAAPDTMALGEQIYVTHLTKLENHQLSRRQQTHGRMESGEITVRAE